MGPRQDIKGLRMHLQNFGVDLGPLLSIVDQSAGATPVQGDTGNFPSASKYFPCPTVCQICIQGVLISK
jgi:hypothetical protein